MTEHELKARLREFALRVLDLCDALPNTPSARAVAGQLSRSGPSPAANYRAACRARSRADFVAKLAISEEEMDESEFWLDLIIARQMLPPPRVLPLFNEANELCRILTKSPMTARYPIERDGAAAHKARAQTKRNTLLRTNPAT